jgi:hypothetical protein
LLRLERSGPRKLPPLQPNRSHLTLQSLLKERKR